MSKMFQVYGIGQALIPVLPPPIGFQSAPTANQNNYEYGQLAYVPPTSPTAFYVFCGGSQGWIDITIGGSSGIFTINTNNPTGGNYTLAGTTGQIAVSQTAGTSTFSLTGPYTPATYPQYTVLVGAGSDSIVGVGPGSIAGQILQSGGPSANPAYSTAVYPSTITANQILYSNADNTVTGLSTQTTATLVTDSSGVPSLITTSVDGQILIGSGSAPPAFNTLTAGTGISIVNSSNNVTISSTATGVTWVDQTTGSVMLAPGTAYLTDNGASSVAYSLPATADQFDTYQIAGYSGGGFTVTQGDGQSITYLQSATTTGTGGSIASVDSQAQLTIVCVVANTTFLVTEAVGNVTIT